MKKLLTILMFVPLFSFGQKFEVSANCGVETFGLPGDNLIFDGFYHVQQGIATPYYSISFTRFIGKHIGIGLNYSIDKIGYTTTFGSKTTTNYLANPANKIGAFVEYDYPVGKFTPFVGVGAGYLLFSNDKLSRFAVEKFTGFCPYINAGVKYAITPILLVNINAKIGENYISSEHINGVNLVSYGISAGLSVKF